MIPIVILICVTSVLLVIFVSVICVMSVRAIRERRQIENSVNTLSELYSKDSDEFRRRLELYHQESHNAVENMRLQFESLDSRVGGLSDARIRDRERVENRIEALSESYGENTSELHTRIDSNNREFLDAVNALTRKLESLDSRITGLSDVQAQAGEHVKSSIEALSASYGEAISELRAHVELRNREIHGLVDGLDRKLDTLDSHVSDLSKYQVDLKSTLASEFQNGIQAANQQTGLLRSLLKDMETVVNESLSSLRTDLGDLRRTDGKVREALDKIFSEMESLHSDLQRVESFASENRKRIETDMQSQCVVNERVRTRIEDVSGNLDTFKGQWKYFFHTPLDGYVASTKREAFPISSVSSAGSATSNSLCDFTKDFTERDINMLKQEKFVRFFENCSLILDVGCGKGEFLQLCREHGLEAVGIDFSEEKVNCCLQNNLRAHRADVFSYLSQNDLSFDGIMCSHLIEHLSPERFLGLTRLVSERLRIGGTFVVLTPNPRSLRTQLHHFWKDLTHCRFYDIESICHLLEQSGFDIMEVGEYDEIEGTKRVER